MSIRLDSNGPVPWKSCAICRDTYAFKSPRDFSSHLREYHCSKEGGSYVCRYGMNGTCPSLPLEGVSDRDYEDHVSRVHVHADGGARPKVRNSSNHDGTHPPHSSTIPDSNPSIVQDQYKWTVYNASVNLPAVLNDPRLAKRETDFFTKTWGQEFDRTDVHPSPHIPEITADHFDNYLKRTAGRFKKHQRNAKQAGETPHPSIEAFPALALKQLEKNRAELDQIPKLFFLPNFSLENPDTFNNVFPWTQVEESKGAANSGTRQSSKLLQEKLSHYLDVVEVQIAKQISVKSNAFFHAMTSHDQLQEQLLATCQAIKQLRDHIHNLDERLAIGPLKILRLSRSRANYMQLLNKLKLMSTVHQTQPTVQVLLSTNDFVAALDLIFTTQEVLTQELAGIHSFRHLSSQLAELEKLIDKMLQADFVKHITAELNRPVTDTEPIHDEEKLVAIVNGMLWQHKYNFIDVYREEAFLAGKAIVRQTIVEAVVAVDDAESEGNITGLADRMRQLNYPQWMQLLTSIFSNLMVLLNRGKAFHGVIGDLVRKAGGRDQELDPAEADAASESSFHLRVSVSEDVDVMIPDAEYTKVIGNLKEMLFAICDHAHDRCIKVMTARAKDGFLERLSSGEFVELSKLVEKFVADVEDVCGRRSTLLSGTLQNQASKFVGRFHEERKTKLSLILDNERWKQADVPTEFQDLVDFIAHSTTLRIPEKRTDSERKPGEYLLVESEKYAVVGTVLMLLKMVMEYCQCVNDIPTVAADLLTRLIELLKMFNSRTCQLILGAGALQLVGLKTITTKNLALASRCLQLVIHYMPRIRSHFEEKLPAKNLNMLKHFDQIAKDYRDHVEEIDNKLVSIMENSIESQLSKYEVKAPMPSPCFRSVCKQMAKLHEALIDILPAMQVKAIFVRINRSFKKLLAKHLVRLNVVNDGGPQQGLVMSDLTFYAGSFRALRGVEDLSDDTTDVWSLR